ncbi:hypothetical protein ACFSL6_03885 [Paenibacillus thailandensis]|uniref:DUF2157 domain-containing protein n=1 Tax=Paenibacillus thailandensis TaxID=393250 RepID=A0ABW5R197_9BACL
MNEERRQIIVREIAHWRRNKLLPEQYCDFLFNLYAKPEDLEASTDESSPLSFGKALSAVQKATGKQWLFTIGIFTLISFVVLYFNAFHPVLQIAVVLVAVAALLWLGRRIRVRQEAMGLSLIGIAMLVLVGGGSYMLGIHNLEEWGYQTGLILLCAVFWIVYGIMARIPIVHLCGWLTLSFVYATVLARYLPEAAWYETQLFWLPVSLLFGWATWFMHRFAKAVSAVLFVTCAVLWFMPEVYQMLFMGETAWIQLQLLAKIGVAGGLLFYLRKQWMVWVA